MCVFSDKTDSSFSQSHSSSMTSLDNINKEAIQCLVFTDAYARKAGKHDTHTLAYKSLTMLSIDVPLYPPHVGS